MQSAEVVAATESDLFDRKWSALLVELLITEAQKHREINGDWANDINHTD